MDKMTILVTGGTGYIGNDVVNKLSKSGHVRLLTRRNVRTKLETVRGDIRDLNSVRKAMAGVDTVLHMAAETSRTASAEDTWHTNVIGTKNVLQAAKEKGVRKVVYTSSEAVSMPILDDFGRSKTRTEELVRNYRKFMEIPVIRAPMIYDKGKLCTLKKFRIIPMIDRDITLHLAYKGTVVEAVVNAMKYGKSELYHVADAKPVSLHALYAEITDCLGLKPFFIPYSFVDVGAHMAGIVEGTFKTVRLKPPVTADYIRSIFQDRVFDTAHSSKTLKYHPVDTLPTIRKILKTGGA
jgi:nucleoside-diphosphate-sugar epimerase